MNRFVIPGVFVVVVVAAGILHGNATHRWSAKPNLDEYVQRLKTVPTNFDGWTSEENPAFQDDLKAHGIEGYTYRTYRNRNSTETYRVFVVVGPGGKVAAHTPDVCNRGAGYTSIGEQKRNDIPSVDAAGNADGKKSHEMFKLGFKPPATRASDGLEPVYHWCWLVPGKTFRAPDVPRLEFGPQPVLYKIYVIHDRPAAQNAVSASGDSMGVASPTPQSAASHDPTKFLQAFLPKVEAALNGPAKP